MRKRQLFIDTRFSQLQSSDLDIPHESSLNFQQTNQSYDLKEQAIFNYMLLDLYYQGLQKVEAVFDRKQMSELQHSFNLLKIKIMQPLSKTNTRNESHASHNSIQFKPSPYKRNAFNSGMDRGREKERDRKKEKEESGSVDKINLLNSIADRIIETKRIKSESKKKNNFITQQDGKKIMSKLEKLEKIIKSIKKQNQMSNKGSVIYVDRFSGERYMEQEMLPMRQQHRQPPPSRYTTQERYSSYTDRYPQRYTQRFQQRYPPTDRYPDSYIEQRLLTRNDEKRSAPKRRANTPIRNPYDFNVIQQQYSDISERHREQYEKYIEEQQRLRPMETVPLQYQQHRYNPHHPPEPAYDPQLIRSRQQQFFESKRYKVPQAVRIPTRSNHYLSEDDDSASASYDEPIKKNGDISINQQVNNIKNQLHELKKMNTQYINKNNVGVDTTNPKLRKKSYQNTGKAQLMAPQILTSPLNFRPNFEEFNQREIRNIGEEQRQAYYERQRTNQHANYNYQHLDTRQYLSRDYYHNNQRPQRGQPIYQTEQYFTPVSGSYYPYSTEAFHDTRRQIPNKSKEREPTMLYNTRYQ